MNNQPNFTCYQCGKAISYDGAGSMNPETGDPVCRRCVAVNRFAETGETPDYIAARLHDKINTFESSLRAATNGLTRATNGSKPYTMCCWSSEINRLTEILTDLKRRLQGLE